MSLCFVGSRLYSPYRILTVVPALTPLQAKAEMQRLAECLKITAMQ